MPQSEPNMWLGLFVLAGASASLATWLILFSRFGLGPYLAYEPRRPVPWGPPAILLALLMVLVALLQNPEWDASELLTTLDLVQRIAMGTLQVFFITAVFFAVVVAASGAKQQDVGLPELAGDLGRDIKIGATTCLAALVPVIGLQAILVRFVDEPVQHPLVKMVLQDPHPAVMVLSLIAAVVIAPVCEEIAFRLLLQGWLEKWEDRWANPPLEADQVLVGEDTESSGQGDKQSMTSDSPPCLPLSLSPFPAVAPPSRGLFGLPHGWVPIAVSSLLFALAHLGHGTDPVPLFFLALMLGYTYQRTHHIVPCIVTHMLFNLVSLVALGLTIYAR